MASDIQELERIARAIRLDIVHMVGIGQRGHLGGSCSIADLVAALYFYKMRHNPANLPWPDRDRFLLSRGHAALVQYAALAESGYFPKEELKKVKRCGAILQGHPDLKSTPGIEANTGSLGQGLSIACGIAAGLIGEVLQGRSAPMNTIGIDDRFGQSARSFEDLLQVYGLSSKHVAAAVRQLL